MAALNVIANRFIKNAREKEATSVAPDRRLGYVGFIAPIGRFSLVDATRNRAARELTVPSATI
jgi:hypothetical protein